MTATGLVVAPHTVGAAELSTRRKVGARHDGQDVIDIAVGIARLVFDGAAEFTQVVRWNVGRHADRDTRRTICEQVRQARRQYDGLEHLTVEVRLKIDCLSIDIAQHFLREVGEPGFGVAIRGGRVAVD